MAGCKIACGMSYHSRINEAPDMKRMQVTRMNYRDVWLAIARIALLSLSVVAISCDGIGGKSGYVMGKGKQACALGGQAWVRSLTSELGVRVSGRGDRRMDISRLQVVDVRAKDGKGNTLVSKFEIWPDSKFGPVVVINVSSDGASGAKIVIEARLVYRGRRIALYADFVKGDDSDWESMDVVVQNEIEGPKGTTVNVVQGQESSSTVSTAQSRGQQHEDIGLTDEQKKMIEDIRKDAMVKAKDAELKDRRAIFVKMRKDIYAVLTEEQIKRLKKARQ